MGCQLPTSTGDRRISEPSPVHPRGLPETPTKNERLETKNDAFQNKSPSPRVHFQVPSPFGGVRFWGKKTHTRENVCLKGEWEKIGFQEPCSFFKKMF